MRLCWSVSDKARPGFRDSHVFSGIPQNSTQNLEISEKIVVILVGTNDRVKVKNIKRNSWTRKTQKLFLQLQKLSQREFTLCNLFIAPKWKPQKTKMLKLLINSRSANPISNGNPNNMSSSNTCYKVSFRTISSL